MIFNRETVGFVLNPGDQLKPFAVPVDGNLHIIIIQPAGSVFVILNHSADRDRQSEAVQNLQRHVDLPPPAVHHDQIRQPVKATVRLDASLESPAEHFLHTRIIIGPLHRLDPEFPIVCALGFSFFVDNHRSDRLKPADVRNIISFNPVQSRKFQPSGDFLHRSGRARLFSLDTFPVLIQNNFRISLGQLHKLFLRSLFRHTNMNAPSPFPAQILFDQFLLLNLFRKHQLSGNKRSSCIKLFDETEQHLGFCVALSDVKIIVFPSDQLAGTDKENLRHRILLVHRQGNHIFVLAVAVCDFLPFSDSPDMVDHIPVLHRLLIIHRL